MSVEAQTWAFSVPLPKQPCAKSVLVALANRADEDGYCWPGIEDLERRTEWNRRSIQRAIKVLIEKRLLLVSAQFSVSGRQRTNLYRLAVGPVITTIACGEGDTQSPRRVTHCHGEGDTQSPPRVTHSHGEGDTQSPKSSSESSEESSRERIVGPTPDEPSSLWAVAEGILEFLNKKTGRHYQPRKPNKDPTTSLTAVHGLLKVGYTEQQLRQVIGNRLVKWGDDPKMQQYLRPETLFRSSKFEQYLGEVGAA